MSTRPTRLRIDKKKATAEICQIFKDLKPLTQTDKDDLHALRQGKLFELYVLAKLTEDLKSRGCQLEFKGRSIRFKQAPGKLTKKDPHFVVTPPSGEDLRLFVDIEFLTLGYHIRRKRKARENHDRSAIHELDLVLVCYRGDGYPTHKQIVVAVECKSNAKLRKNSVREALGLRRELSFFAKRVESKFSCMAPAIEKEVPADPPSEFRFAFIDPDGVNYTQSPEEFGIDLNLYKLKFAEPDAKDPCLRESESP